MQGEPVTLTVCVIAILGVAVANTLILFIFSVNIALRIEKIYKKLDEKP